MLQGIIYRGRYIPRAQMDAKMLDPAYLHSHHTHIMEDSKPLMSTANGEMLTSRRQIREHCKIYGGLE